MPDRPEGIAASCPCPAVFGSASALKDVSPEDQLDEFISKYAPEIAAQTRTVLAKMRASLPGAVELVYDNYNALVIGFSPSERTSDAVFSIAVYPRWINLFFLRGTRLPDPGRLLKGTGKSVRHVVLDGPKTLDTPAVRTLMGHALKKAPQPFDPRQSNRTVIKSIAARQRPRRPV
jgi:hypothetical protein